MIWSYCAACMGFVLSGVHRDVLGRRHCKSDPCKGGASYYVQLQSGVAPPSLQGYFPEPPLPFLNKLESSTHSLF